jgi:sugar phosphate isomerase/epimerase
VNPFLCCESEEIAWLCDSVAHDLFGILLDTAHLKVSCVTLQKDKEAELEKIFPYIKAIHHSDNDGNADENLPLSDAYWFLPYMTLTRNMPHVLEVKDLSVMDINQQLKYLSTPWN